MPLQGYWSGLEPPEFCANIRSPSVWNAVGICSRPIPSTACASPPAWPGEGCWVLAIAASAPHTGCSPPRPGAPSHGRPRRAVELRDLDQLQCFAAGALDHHGARVAERVGLFEEPDALTAQLRDPGVEVGDAECDVI
jgi:hypothetical protein